MFGLGSLLLVVGAIDGGADSLLVQRARDVMHTKVLVAIAGEQPDAGLDQAFDETFAIFEHIDATMNEWRPESPLGKINALAGNGKPVEAPADLCDVIRLALDGARRTDGLFDPTWAALRDVWKFTDAPNQAPPDPARVKQACALVSWRDVEVTANKSGTCSVRLKKKGMALGLGGFVKGCGVDRAVELLRARGFKNFFVQAGGDLYLAGKNGSRPWVVGIRDPRGAPEQRFAKGALSDVAFSTSGDYEHFFIHEGRRYHHIIDLRTCQPASASVSSTVMSKTAVDAEILTKSTFILGAPAGLKLARTFGAEAVIVHPDGQVNLTPVMQEKLELWPPTGLGPPP